MTAIDKREALEAAVRAQLTRAWKYGINPGGDRPMPYEVIMAAAETYANAAAGEAIDNLTRGRRQADRRATLADAIGVQS
jgi:hypothetical protein